MLKIEDAASKLSQASRVFALSATLGGRIGKERLNQRFEDGCKVLDTTDELKAEGNVHLDVHVAGKQRNFGTNKLLAKALSVVHEKLEEDMCIIVYLKDLKECNSFAKKL